MVCVKCGAQSPDGNEYCGQCGSRLTVAPPAAAPTPGTAGAPVPGEPGAYYCARHPKTITRLRCGRCEVPICPKCTVFGAAGTRCRACARNKVGVRPLGMLHDAGSAVGGVAGTGGRTIWYMVIWYIIMDFLRGFMRW